MDLKVISFNVRCCDDLFGNTVEERAPRLNEVITKYDPDLIGVQEYSLLWEKPFEKYFLPEYEIYSNPRSSSARVECVPVMWKRSAFECLEKSTFWLSDTPEVESRGWDEKYNVNRICTYAVLKSKKDGKIFTFMNTHFGFGDNCQTKSSKLIYEYSKKIADGPCFCTGDFNMTSESLGYKEIVKHLTDVNAVTLKYDGVTFHGYNPEKHSGGPIDFCFVNDKVVPKTCKVINDLVDGKYPSDHYGMYFELEI